jgi:hypothetical protein
LIGVVVDLTVINRSHKRADGRALFYYNPEIRQVNKILGSKRQYTLQQFISYFVLALFVNAATTTLHETVQEVFPRKSTI